MKTLHTEAYYTYRSDVINQTIEDGWSTEKYRLTAGTYGTPKIVTTYRPQGWDKKTQIKVKFSTFFNHDGKNYAYLPRIEVLVRQVDDKMRLIAETPIFRTNVRGIIRSCPFCNNESIVKLNDKWICSCGFNYSEDSCRALSKTPIRRGVINPNAFQVLMNGGQSFILGNKYVL
jgi:hypothetical protein